MWQSSGAVHVLRNPEFHARIKHFYSSGKIVSQNTRFENIAMFAKIYTFESVFISF